jgi:hypothetical protein
VSDIHPGPVMRAGELFVGDAILNANGIDLKDSMHADAVKILSNLVIIIKFQNTYINNYI